ncbi:hypothetical protein [Lichenihabitans psoromatis]|uniref:hypothetical protein n=1 Tax=Lichenihabitans psoromatis TaxID=2528642 RepID=UPI001036AE40|nr:hypothetical protein [Lichenihabitans psoromatis]
MSIASSFATFSPKKSEKALMTRSGDSDKSFDSLVVSGPKVGFDHLRHDLDCIFLLEGRPSSPAQSAEAFAVPSKVNHLIAIGSIVAGGHQHTILTVHWSGPLPVDGFKPPT